MVLARDVMTQNPVCLKADTLVTDAVGFFLQNYVSSAPVMAEDGRVLGQLSEINLMRAFVKTKVQASAPPAVGDFRDLFSVPQFVKTSTPIPDVVAALIRCPLHRVLVQDGTNRLVGIISPKDILRALSDETNEPLLGKLRELETQVKNLGQNLKKAEAGFEQYSRLFESSPLMIHSVDRTGTIQMANPLLHEFLGYGAGELIGKTIYDIYPKTLHEVVRKGLEKIVDQGHHDLSYSSYITKEGAVHRVEVISSSLKDGKGYFVGTVTLSRPVDGDMLLRALHGVLE